MLRSFIISVPPDVTGPTSPIIHVAEFNMSSIACTVTSFPASTVTWFFASDKINFADVTSQAVVQQLPSTTYESKLTSELKFSSNVSRTDRGAYYCQVVNSEGSVRKDTEIDVDCKYLSGVGMVVRVG